MSKQLIICFVAALAMIIIVETAPQPSTTDGPDPSDEQKCGALSTKISEQCMELYPTDLNPTNTENWAHDKTKCCTAWNLFRCIENGTTPLMKLEICKSTLLEPVLTFWLNITSSSLKEHGCVKADCE